MLGETVAQDQGITRDVPNGASTFAAVIKAGKDVLSSAISC